MGFCEIGDCGWELIGPLLPPGARVDDRCVLRGSSQDKSVQRSNHEMGEASISIPRLYRSSMHTNATKGFQMNSLRKAFIFMGFFEVLVGEE